MKIIRRAIEYKKETDLDFFEAIYEIVSICQDKGTDWLENDKTAFPWYFELKPNANENAFRVLN